MNINKDVIYNTLCTIYSACAWTNVHAEWTNMPYIETIHTYIIGMRLVYMLLWFKLYY